MRPGARHRLSGPRCERLASGILRLAFCGEHSASQELAVRFSAKEALRPPCGFSPLERRGSDSGLENSYFPKLELPPRSRTSSFGNLETRARGPRGSGSGERALSFLQVDAPRLKNGRLASGKELSYSREASRFRTSISTKLRSTELQFKQKSAFPKRKTEFRFLGQVSSVPGNFFSGILRLASCGMALHFQRVEADFREKDLKNHYAGDLLPETL